LPNNLPKPLIKDFQNRWQSFQAAMEAAAIPPITNTTVLKSIEPVFAFSDFVAASCIREPAMLVDLIDSGDLKRHLGPEGCNRNFEKLLAEVDNEAALIGRLRRFRRREMVRIAWRDLAGWADLAETMSDLSAFADTCLDRTLRILYQWQCDKFGVPAAADGSQQHLVVLGLGK
jgi:glutamate-ammonia-ligase adenylyltransferase